MKPKNLFQAVRWDTQRSIHSLSVFVLSLIFDSYLPLPIVFCFLLDIRSVPGHSLPGRLSGPSRPPTPKATSRRAHSTTCLLRKPPLYSPFPGSGLSPRATPTVLKRAYPEAGAWVKGRLPSGRVLAVGWVRKSKALKHAEERRGTCSDGLLGQILDTSQPPVGTHGSRLCNETARWSCCRLSLWQTSHWGLGVLLQKPASLPWGLQPPENLRCGTHQLATFCPLVVQPLHSLWANDLAGLLGRGPVALCLWEQTGDCIREEWGLLDKWWARLLKEGSGMRSGRQLGTQVFLIMTSRSCATVRTIPEISRDWAASKRGCGGSSTLGWVCCSLNLSGCLAHPRPSASLTLHQHLHSLSPRTWSHTIHCWLRQHPVCAVGNPTPHPPGPGQPCPESTGVPCGAQRRTCADGAARVKDPGHSPSRGGKKFF